MRHLYNRPIWMRLAAWAVALMLAGPLARASETPAAGAPASGVSRIAIVADPDCANLAALVTTELSGDPGLHLVEREDLAKVGDELKLQKLAAQDTVSLGKLVGADGLIFLHQADTGFGVRLTAVTLGYALYDGKIAEGSDPAVAARSIALLVSGYAPKLRLDPLKAIPISVLNLRAEYATAQSALLERRLTLLLESRLTAVPEYVLLERRHAGVLAFERSLEPGVRPLLPGSYLVDGSIGLPPSGTGDVTVHMRLVSSRNSPQTFDVRGDVNDLPALAEKLTTAIRHTTGHALDPGEWQPEKEAREYLLEALWAWQQHARAAAWEAADSAGLLGEQSADLAALRVNLLLDRAGEGIVHPGGLPTGKRPIEGRSLNERTDDLLQAIADAARYSDGHLETKIELSNPRQNLDVRAGEMKKMSILLGTELLALLDEAGSPRADEVRRALRVFTGYDPLYGKPGTHSPARPWLAQDIYTDRWALTLDEALTWLRLSCALPDGFVPPWLVTGQGEGFCRRFLRTPEEQKASFAQFVTGLADDPAARLAALIIQTGSSDPAKADAACRAYLNALWPLREILTAEGSHRREWTDLGHIPDPVRQRQADAMIPLLRYYLTHATSFEFGSYCIAPMWLPQQWSAADAAAVWADYQDCKPRMEQDRRARGFNASWLAHEQAKLEDPLLKKFPALAALGRPPGGSLPVTRFWSPWRTSGHPKVPFIIPDAVASEGALFVLGAFQEATEQVVCRITPGFQTEVIAAPEKMNAQHLEVTPDAISVDYYALGQMPDAERHRTGRFDRRSRSWSTSTVTPPDAEYEQVSGQTFVHLPDALGRINPSTGSMDLLISDRRKPPRSPLDDAQQARDARVFAGPGNRPCVACQLGVFYVQVEPGPWSPVFDAGEWPTSITRDGSTVVVTWSGEAVLLDPARSEPEYLMAPAGMHYRKPPPDGQKTGGVTTTPWREQTYWDPPGQERGSIEISADRIAWYGERFFVLEKPAGKSQAYGLLLYTKKGGRTPRRVPLEFRLGDATRQLLAPIYPGDKSSDRSIDSIEHPGQGFFALKPIADLQGLWLYSFAGGVWFIPYADLDDYVNNRAVVPVDTAPPSGNSTASSAKTTQSRQ